MRENGSVLVGRKGLADLLTEYITASACGRWSWGETDCFLFAADWVQIASHRDPAAEYRGAYTNEREARRLLRSRGGPIVFVRERLSAIGMKPTIGPQLGDVGLVRVAFKHWRDRVISVPVAAICTGPMWCIRTSEGVAFRNFPIIQAWSLPDG